jgi:hypothetical protein
MKSIPFLLLAALIIALFALGLAPVSAPAAIATATIAPASYSTQKGGSGGQNVYALSVMDQTGSDDNWNSYVEFTTPGVAYSGFQTFKLPAYITASKITALILHVNFRGPIASTQTWSWQIYDWGSARWIALGNNTSAPDWIWTEKTFTIPSPFARYVNGQRQIRIRLKSNNAVDDFDLDYEALEITYNGSVPTTTPTASPTPDVARWNPSVGMTWQLQFSGTLNTSIDAQVYDVDLFDTSAAQVAALHAQGAKVLCYISVGSWEDWRPDADQFPASVIGNDYDGWPGEKWLDIRRINLLAPILRARFDLCKANGFDGIEPDNVNGYTNNTGFPLTYGDQLKFNRWVANEAHARGLSIGLKNDNEQVADLLDYFDFAVTEDCFDQGWCADVNAFIGAGKPVFAIEYTDLTTLATFTNVYCPLAATMQFSLILKNRNLDAARWTCP